MSPGYGQGETNQTNPNLTYPNLTLTYHFLPAMEIAEPEMSPGHVSEKII